MKGSQFSYRDKLLSLGDSGFLEINISASEALNGWKNYFAKMSEKSMAEEEPDEDDGQYGEEECHSWQQGGKYPKLKFTAEEYETWCKPYMNSLVVKLLGKSFRVGFMCQRMERMWNPKSPMKVTPLNNGYFMVSFSTREDRDYALLEGPWMIADHYLMVQRWRPNFNPWKADYQKRIAVWIRFPDLPAELYNVESLRRLGNLVGKTLKIDRRTAFSKKGGFTRVCVELDLHKPLLPFFNHFGEDRKIEYEGLHLVCFNCGQYGHHFGVCPHKGQEAENGKEADGESPEVVSETETRRKGQSGVSEEQSEAIGPISGKNQANAISSGSNGGKFGPHMLVKREFGRLGRKEDLVAYSVGVDSRNGSGIQKAAQKGKDSRVAKDKAKTDGRKVDKEGGLLGERRKFGAEINKNMPEKMWVPVQEKRVSGIKRRARGKENVVKGKMPARATSSVEGHGTQDGAFFATLNPFSILASEVGESTSGDKNETEVKEHVAGGKLDAVPFEHRELVDEEPSQVAHTSALKENEAEDDELQNEDGMEQDEDEDMMGDYSHNDDIGSQ